MRGDDRKWWMASFCAATLLSPAWAQEPTRRPTPQPTPQPVPQPAPKQASPTTKPAGDAPAVAPLQLPALRELFTPDGSRVVLVPTGGAPVVHWVVATPAGVLEEPAGLEGLSFAVARASLAGTGLASSRDGARESEALAALDRFEQGLDQARVRGTVLPDTVLATIEQARITTAALFDPLAWERTIREIPALGAELHEVAEGTLLQITTSPAGIPRVAQLLYERREGKMLRGIHGLYRDVRQQLARRRATGTRGAMRREVLGLSFLGHPYGRAYAMPDTAVSLSMSQAIAVWQQTQHPSRSCHVLVGGFDANVVAAALRAAFARTQIPPLAPPPQLPLSVGEVERRASLTGGKFEAVTIGYRLPARLPVDVVRVFAQWLAGSKDAELPAALRRSGRPEATVTVTAPFPGRTSGLLLLEIEDTRPRPPDGLSLLDLVDPVLRRLPESAPELGAVNRAATAVQVHSTASRLGNENLALHLALACGLEGQRADAALSSGRTVTPAMVHRLVQLVLVRKNRAVVKREVAR